jgi:hypothetical protein
MRNQDYKTPEILARVQTEILKPKSPVGQTDDPSSD